MGGEHKWFLFMSSNTSKKEEGSVQWKSEFFDALQWENKNHSSTFHGMMFLFHIYQDFYLLTITFQILEAIWVQGQILL